MPSPADQIHLQSQADAGPSTLPPSPVPGPSTPLPPAAPPKGPHRMRIATQGKVRNYREFAVRFLQENPSRPLVLHTLPPLPSSAPAPAERSHEPARSKKPKAAATSTIPMLVTAVEQIKRAYLELYAGSVAKGKARADDDVGQQQPRPMLGLWQYNETGCMEDLEEYGAQALEPERDELAEAERALQRLKDVLGGKAGPKMVHTPYMRVTLSTHPLPDLAAQRHITYQHVPLPAAPKRSKAKARAKRRALQAEGAAAARVGAGAGETAGGAREAERDEDARGGPLTALARKIAGPAAAAALPAAPAAAMAPGKERTPGGQREGKRRAESGAERGGALKRKKLAGP